MRREAPELAQYMASNEYGNKQIDADEARAQLNLEEDVELNYLLINFTSDSAKEMVQLREGELGVEIWRALCQEHDPQTGTVGAQAMGQLIRPERAKDISALKKLLLKWDATLKQETRSGGPAAKLQDEVKAAALMSMMPESMRQDALKKGKTTVENY